MIEIAIAFLWFLIGVIVLLGAIYLLFYVLGVMGVAVPPRLAQGIYLVVLILIIIYALMIISGGVRAPSLR